MVRGMLCPNGNVDSLMNVFDERQKRKIMCIFDNKQGGNLSYFQNALCFAASMELTDCSCCLKFKYKFRKRRETSF